MSGKSDEVKGRVKKAVGDLTDNDRMRREGKIDEATGKAKQAAEKVANKVKDAAHRANRP